LPRFSRNLAGAPPPRSCWLDPTLEEKHAARVAKIERDRRAATSS
jgi:hypothetical protein